MIASYEPTGNVILDQLCDALVEHDPDDQDFGDPTNWPAWTNVWRAELGAPLCFAERIPDEVIHDPDQVDLESWIELSPDLDTPDSRTSADESIEPEPSDIDWIVEEAARREYERMHGFNARFV
ncbi:MAG: hypothetical protein ABSH35_00730 [Isosphaeraceae bacterium]|jgi:hypothetical protein